MVNPSIASKYNDKLIFDYPLKKFREDGYSKEVKLLQADLEPFERALQAVILSQYRRKIFEKNKKFIKPVILFKSKTINESKSFFDEFIESIKKLSDNQLKSIKQNLVKSDSGQISLGYGKASSVLRKAFKYFEDNKISLDNLISELQNDFAASKCITVNSKEESEAKQIAVNTLEDSNNEYRAVFAVDKLNEGWDVLNLFDIVRLYNTRDFNKKTNSPGRTTMSEAQLIGRGARYCPFRINDDDSLYTRKYDQDVESELRICEELYYHSPYNVKYITELNMALEEIGIKAPRTFEKELKLKESFQETNFYKTGYIFLNEWKKYNREDIFSMDAKIINRIYSHKLHTGYLQTTDIFERINKSSIKAKTISLLLKDLGNSVLRTALNKLEFYQFSNILTYFPHLESISEFITSENFLGKIKIEIEGPEELLKELHPEQKLKIALDTLIPISQEIAADKIEYKGTKEFRQYQIRDKFYDKTLNFSLDPSSDKEFGKSMSNPSETSIYLDLSKKDWFVFQDNFGTSEEKYLIKFIDKVYANLRKKYDEIYLVRNERHFKLYNFEDGNPIEPDFVLFLMKEDPKEALYYQIIIEPKGQHLFKQDEWKQKFLLSLKKEHLITQLWKGKKFIVWGMPFYNKDLEREFEISFDSIIN